MKIMFALISLLGFTFTAKAEDNDFTAVNMTNLVATVKAQAKAAIGSKDDAKYRTVVTNIEAFASAVAMEISLPADTKAEVKETLSQLNTLLTEVTGRFNEMIIAHKQRIEDLKKNKETGTAYGLNVEETRTQLVIPTLERYTISYENLAKRMTNLSAKLEAQVKRLN